MNEPAKQAASLTPEQFLKLIHDIEGFDPSDLIPSAVPGRPTPEWEAHQLVRMIGRNGTTADSLRTLIDVTPAQADYLRRVTAKNPLKRKVVELSLKFREDVRAAFEAELADPRLAAVHSEANGEP